jgi:hypothetical protein
VNRRAVVLPTIRLVDQHFICPACQVGVWGPLLEAGETREHDCGEWLIPTGSSRPREATET